MTRRFLLLLSVTCMGYAMNNGRFADAINGPQYNENQRLLNRQRDQENCVQAAVRYCTDRRAGALIVCGNCLCAGLIGVACWHAGCVDAGQASRIVAQVMQ